MGFAQSDDLMPKLAGLLKAWVKASGRDMVQLALRLRHSELF